jgi:hypothetical protein
MVNGCNKRGKNYYTVGTITKYNIKTEEAETTHIPYT